MRGYVLEGRVDASSQLDAVFGGLLDKEHTACTVKPLCHEECTLSRLDTVFGGPPRQGQSITVPKKGDIMEGRG